MTEVRLSPDGSTITVFVPMAWRRRGGRKVIVAPPGSDGWAQPPKIDGVLVKALARAHRWRRLLEEGQFGTLAELADAERISRSYVCRVLRLTLLAPRHRRTDSRRAADERAGAVLETVPGRVGAAARGAAGDPTARGPSNIWFISMRMRRSVVYCRMRRCFIRFMDRWTVRAEAHEGSAIGRQTRCITPGSRAGEPDRKSVV